MAARGEERGATEDREAATRAFEEGERAYRAGDFSRAAERFEEAYRKAPHPAPLWNAARSWNKAGEIARAANGYARYLREAPEGAPDRDEAGKALAELATKLGRIEVFAPEAEDVRVDDQPLEGSSVYVHPGTHVIKGRVRGASVQRTEVLEAGSVRSVALVVEEIVSAPNERPKDPPEEPPRPIVKTPRPSAPIPTAPRADKPWLVPALVASGAATVVSAGLLVWSGIDTLNARSDYDAARTWDKYHDGRDKQFRTNVLVGVSLGLGAITGALGSIWLVGRSGKGSESQDAVGRSEAPSVELKITPPMLGGPAFVGATGSF